MKNHSDNRRILIIDHNESIHTDVRSVLIQKSLDDIDFFSASPSCTKEDSPCVSVKYEIDTAYQEQEGFKLVKEALAEGRPYALAFIDMCTQPGRNGIQTIQEIKKLDPDLQVAICTASSDCSWRSDLDSLGMSDWLLVLKKPFDMIEVQQLAYTLTEKWNLAKRESLRTEKLEQFVKAQSNRLELTNAKLLEQVESFAETNARLATEMEARQEADAQIRHMAFHDSLTSLPNRTMLIEKIDESLARAQNQDDYCFAVLYCDVDNFKLVNDSLGHRVGDQLLSHMAHRLNHSLRTIESASRIGKDMVARLSGDEFVVLLDDIKKAEFALDVAKRLNQSVARKVSIDQNELLPSLSIGIAMCYGEYSDATDLLRDADMALYHGKDSGRGCQALFDEEMRAKVAERMELEDDLRRAIEEKQFVVYYQPIVSLQTEEVVSLEALMRWQHPKRGLIPPDGFVSVAEETGMIEAIGALVLEDSLRQAASWRKTMPGLENLKVNVNFSPRQLVDRGVVARIDKSLELNQLEPSALVLEITESAMMDDLTSVRRLIEDLASRGIEIHLDDFGTGQSSLNVLQSLSFSTIKLHRSFVCNLSQCPDCPTMVQAIIMLAQNRQVKIVAEGVESYDQTLQLKELDCDFGQGSYFSEPLLPAECEKYLQNKSARHAKLPQDAGHSMDSAAQ